jgi:beta-glucosidase
MIKFAAQASVLALVLAPAVHAQTVPAVDLDAAARRAEATVKAMTPAEKTVLTHGMMAIPFLPGMTVPADAVLGAGYVAGLPRLNVPPLKETDASLGVAWVMGLRHDGATALPSGLAQAASWNPQVLYDGGAAIGQEARAKGFNVLLAGGVNLMRDPRNGRTFEYLAEDPLLSGVLVGAAIRGIQSNHIISTIKHFAFNGQETGRKYADVHIGEAAARESDLLAFEIGIEQGHPASVMCSYNRFAGQQACSDQWLLTKVLKQDWGWRGFVMSDWGAVTGLDAAMAGLDQQSGEQLDKAVFLNKPLADKAADPAWAARIDDMNRRVLTAIYATGIDADPVRPGGTIDFTAHAAVAEDAARQGIVLLRNTGVLPLARSARSIAVIGGHANAGVISGAGSSQVQGADGPAVAVGHGAAGLAGAFFVEQYHRSAPLDAITALAPQAKVTWRDGRYITDAVEAARKADVAVVFATEWRSEGADQPDLSLPDGQDALIAAVAAANPHTVVVLETGGPVLMPWLDKTAAVIEAWYPGARGGQAIASVLFGDTNPGGRLPVTFPVSTEQLPRPKLDGSDWVEPNFGGDAVDGHDHLPVDYTIEGADVGYRWFAKTNRKPLFPFGYGLSYTTFSNSGLTVKGMDATFTLTNTGSRRGDDVGQLYLVSRGGKPIKRLVGFRRVTLDPGASSAVSVTIDPRLLADWTSAGWTIPAGDYGFALGDNADATGTPVTVHLNARSWKEGAR